MSRKQESHSEYVTNRQGIAFIHPLFRANGQEADDMVYFQHLALLIAMLFGGYFIETLCLQEA